MTLKSIFDQARAHKVVTAIAAGAVIFLVLYFGFQFFTGIHQGLEDRQVNKLQIQADQKQVAAQKSLDQADKAAVDRKVEDQVRETNIEPQRRQANETSNQARARALKAEADYEKSREKSRTNTGNNFDERLLHERNCADLHELYPGEVIAGCDP